MTSDGLWMRLELLGLLCRRLLNEELPDPARRLLVFLMGHLRYSPHADIVVVSRRFLPVDVGVSADDAARAYEILYERELIERVDALSGGAPDGLALRLVVDGFNDRKQRAAYRPETFGYPGARIGGKPTSGNILTLALPAFVQGSLRGWAVLSDDDRASLRVWLQEAIGSQRAFIEEVAVVGGHDSPALDVKLRLPIDESDSDVQSILASAAESWLRRHVAGLGHQGSAL